MKYSTRYSNKGIELLRDGEVIKTFYYLRTFGGYRYNYKAEDDIFEFFITLLNKETS